MASLIIPAATNQWSDRKGELEVKQGIISDISAAASDEWVAARALAATPEVDLTDGNRNTLPSKGPSASERRRTLLENWIHAEALVDPRIRVYFRNTEISKTWDEYRNAFYDYIALACCDKVANDDIKEIRTFLKQHPLPQLNSRPLLSNPWATLAANQPGDKGFAPVYAWLGLQLLRERTALLSALLTSNARGYSRGWHDFIRDVVAPISPS